MPPINALVDLGGTGLHKTSSVVFNIYHTLSALHNCMAKIDFGYLVCLMELTIFHCN